MASTLATALLRPCAPVHGSIVQPFRSSPHAGRVAPAGRQQRRRVAAAAEGSSSPQQPPSAVDSATPESLAAVKELDALIDTLLAKKGAQELAQTVAGGCSRSLRSC